MRHSRQRTVTAALDSVVFLSPVRVGDVLLLSGRINAAFGSSMEIEVRVGSENPLSGERRLTTTAFVTMVALDAGGHPQQAPALRLIDDEERERERAAGKRRQARLSRRSS
jgi:acyl-CoA hydrolase